MVYNTATYLRSDLQYLVTPITSSSLLILLPGPPTDTAGIPILPIDPLLSTSGIPTLPSLLSLGGPSKSSVLLKLPTSIIADGMPPMPTKVLERMQQWEYTNLLTLLDGVTYKTPNITVSHEGQLLVLGASDHPQSRRKAISDITTYLIAGLHQTYGRPNIS